MDMNVSRPHSERIFRTMIVVAISLAVVGTIGGLSTPPARAASHSVSIANFAFTPNSITIAPGDSITWTNDDSTTHTVTGSDWGSGDLAPGATFSHTFATNGTYAYHCSIHTFMTGTVVVGASSSPPPTNTPHKALLAGGVLLGIVAAAIVIVVIAVVVIVLGQRSQKT